MSSFKRFLLKRLLISIPVLFGLSVVIFVISRVIPGDSAGAALGPRATEEQVEQLREEMGLNEPIYVQYIDWLSGAVQGDLGRSIRTNNEVFSDLVIRLPATLELVTLAMFIAVLCAIPFGVIAGTNKDKWQDHSSRIIALSGISMPRFWVAILFQVTLVGMLGLFPLMGRIGTDPPQAITHFYLIDSLLTRDFEAFRSTLYHMILPATALGLGTFAQVTRLIRSDIIEQDRKDYILAARVYGLPNDLIKYKLMLKNAFSSSLTIIGLAFGYLIGGAFLVEFVFSWPGVAGYGANAVINQDFNAIVGVTMVVGLGFILANLIVDVLYGFLDPRIHLGGNNGD